MFTIFIIIYHHTIVIIIFKIGGNQYFHPIKIWYFRDHQKCSPRPAKAPGECGERQRAAWWWRPSWGHLAESTALPGNPWGIHFFPWEMDGNWQNFLDETWISKNCLELKGKKEFPQPTAAS